jgi:hypothetical protein
LQHHNGIEWKANSSSNGYVVQRSCDGIHFNSITRINASNTSNYTYRDPSLLNSTNYYRLQATGVDGFMAYSNVITVANDDIRISPNTAQNILQAEGLSANAKFTIVDFGGNIAISQKLSANRHSYDLNIASLYAGNYLLKIEVNGEVVTKQFVKE